MNEYLLLKFAHVIAFAYWLGGDLGTFVASNYVVKRNITDDSRHIALKIMLACDQGPKLAMPLIFPLGFHMAVIGQFIAVPDWLLVTVWLLSLYWFATVLVLHFNEGKAFVAILGTMDLYFRFAIVIGLVTLAVEGLTQAKMISTEWIVYKILIFAALVVCGIFIRINLKPFIPAFGNMMAHGASEESNSAMEQSIQRCRPFVWCIWLGLFVNTALGMHLL